MSTLALELAGEFAPAATSEAKPGFWSRLIEARQAQANRVASVHLAAKGDARLTALGYSKDDIRALRAGELRLPSTRQGG